MARGNQKIKAQEENAKRKQAAAKSGSQKDAQNAGLKIVCAVCKAPMTNYNCLKQHYESKHPKETLPGPEAFQ